MTIAETFAMDSDMDPWKLILSHHYDKAISAYESMKRNKQLDSLDLANYSTALLCSGKLQEALVGFENANQVAKMKSNNESSPYLEIIAVIHWLLGERNVALQTLRSSVNGILSGTIKFADNAGGVSQGLLLWYVGVTTKDNRVKDESLNYLVKLAKRARIKYWPGQIGLYILGRNDFKDILFEVTQTKSYEEALVKAKNDLLVRRYLCRILFYEGVNQRNLGNEIGCIKLMQDCFRLENPILELEWYLAQSEIENREDYE